ncbi:MAG TPA: ABC transporter permease [Candidatus Binatia bacterium]|nr:ABC transporter permease [Candidatus Binatia bacterium]
MQKLWQDLRFAMRQLRRSPGFALTTTLTLALGIGATTAIFSLINAVLLRPLPFPDPDRLMAPAALDQSAGKPGLPVTISYPDFFDWRARNHSFEAIACYRHSARTLTGSGTPRMLEIQVVASDFFRVLGVNPILGRGFVREDEKPGTHVAVLSHETWRSIFGGAPDIVGRNITLDRKTYVVIGVMPKGYAFPMQKPEPALWTSLADDAVDPEPLTSQRGADMVEVVGRLRSGVTIAQATADLSLIEQNLATQYPESNKKSTAATVVPELVDLVGNTRPALTVLFAAVLFVLLIACANVAGLMLARATRRRPEIALRSAMGASRWEIMRQVLVESLVLAICSGMAGVALSVLLLKTMLRFVPQNLPRLDQVSVDGTVLAFAAAASILTGVLFGVLPAWRTSRLDPSLALREGVRHVTGGRAQHRLHDTLVVAETAIGLILLIGAGLLIRSFVRVLNVDPGFDSRHLLTAYLNLPENQYRGLQKPQFYEELLSRLRALPGVESAVAGGPIPLSRSYMIIGFTIEGRPAAPGDDFVEAVGIVTPGFFRALRIPLIAGREFQPTDDSRAPIVAIVNQAFARKYFPGQDPIGKRIKPGLGDDITNNVPRQIVGVVGDVKGKTLTAAMEPRYYLPYRQAIIFSPPLIIRTAGDPMGILGPLRDALAQLDSNIPLYRISTADDYISLSAAQPRFQTVLLASFAVIALLLSAVGLYAVLSYMVAQRTLEIGLRLALGAQRDNVLGLVLRRGMLLAATGLAIGIFVSLLLTEFMQGMLCEVRRFDPLTFVCVSAVLLLVSLAASAAPAWRAARLDPMRILREQ